MKDETVKCRNLFSGNGKFIGDYYSPYYIQYLEAGTYTLSGIQEFANIKTEDGSTTIASNSYGGNITFTISTTANYRFVATGANTNINVVNTSWKLMLNKGSEAEPYQEWNGEIVHKKELEPVLLWENTKGPNSSWNSTNVITLSQSYTNFKAIVIGYIPGENKTNIYTKKILTENIRSSEAIDIAHLGTFGSGFMMERKLTFNSTTSATTDDKGIGYKFDGTSYGNANFMIPMYIYGTNIL